jgi:hypothetical protein
MTGKVEIIVVIVMKMIQTMIFVSTITEMTKEHQVSGHIARTETMRNA